MINNAYSPNEQEDIAVLENVGNGDIAELLVLNDDHNTFDWVIKCLIDVCGHSAVQAEQSSLIIHYNGKATVKTAPFNQLRPMKDALVERGLSVIIERVEAPQ